MLGLGVYDAARLAVVGLVGEFSFPFRIARLGGVGSSLFLGSPLSIALTRSSSVIPMAAIFSGSFVGPYPSSSIRLAILVSSSGGRVWSPKVLFLNV